MTPTPSLSIGDKLRVKMKVNEIRQQLQRMDATVLALMAHPTPRWSRWMRFTVMVTMRASLYEINPKLKRHRIDPL